MKGDNFLSKIFLIIIAIVELILGLRLVVKLLGAKSEGIFDFIYDISLPLIDPFIGVLDNTTFGGNNRFVLEWSTLFAMIAYAILGFILVKVIDYIVSNMNK